MNVELRALSTSDGREIFDMIKEVGPGENGYSSVGHDVERDVFSDFLAERVEMSTEAAMKSGRVPETIYWLYVDGRPVGIGKLRDYLNDFLRGWGGHIGYTIRPSERGKGYGNIILRELLKEARRKGIEEVLILCNVTNAASRRVIEANGCELIDERNEHYYWRKRLI